MIQTESIRAFCRFCNIPSILNTKIQNFKNIHLANLKYASAKVSSLYKNLEKFEKIKNANPNLYRLICQGYKSGELEDNALKVYIDFIDKPIEDYRTRQAALHYKHEGYKFMNTFLRTGKFKRKYPDGTDIPVSSEYKVKIKKEVKTIQDYMKGREFSFPLTLYRGDDYICLSNVVIKHGQFKGQKLSDVLQKLENKTDIERKIFIKEILKENDGLFIENKAFLSTSFSKKGAKNQKPVFLTMQTKEKIYGICPDFIPNPHIKELEFLVKNGSKSFIKKLDYKNNKWFIDTILKN